LPTTLAMHQQGAACCIPSGCISIFGARGKYA
jgi:hypothetical protein